MPPSPSTTGSPVEATLTSEAIFVRSKPVRIGVLSNLTRIVSGREVSMDERFTIGLHRMELGKGLDRIPCELGARAAADHVESSARSASDGAAGSTTVKINISPA